MNESVNNHPIFNNSQFLINTPMIGSLKDQIIACIWNGISGAVVYGRSRTGKSRAINHIKTQIYNCHGETIPSEMISVAPRDIGTIASVFRNVLLACGFKVKKHATADEMSNILLHHLGELSLSNSTKQVILIVDELQRLQPKQFEAFAELYDGLVTLGSNLFVLFTGNESASRTLVSSMNEQRYELIRGRFFTQEFEFKGITTYEELKFCLTQYDVLCYPKGGPTYTQYFTRSSMTQIWELSSLTDLIWGVYCQYFQIPFRIKSWPMQYFVSMVRVLLTAFLPQYGIGSIEQTKSMINESIKVSGLVSNLVKECT